jgi:hypothetical protein
MTDEEDNFRRRLEGTVHTIAGEAEETMNCAAIVNRTGFLQAE